MVKDSSASYARFRGKIRRVSDILLKRKKCGNLKKGNEIQEDVEFSEIDELINDSKPTIGRRIIDIAYFGKQFDKGCSRPKCKQTLKWKKLIEESHFGLCVAFKFKCEWCNQITQIYSSQWADHSSFGEKNQRRPFSVNVKAALAMIHSGIGPDIFNAILSVLGLPTIDKKTLKKRERDIGPVIETVAKKSCFAASETEQVLEMNAGGDNKPNSFGMKGDSCLDDSRQVDVNNDIRTEDTQMTLEEILDFLDIDEHTMQHDLETESWTSDVTEEETNLATSQHQDGLVHETILPRNKLVGVGVSQDGAWPKRGRAMNSLSESWTSDVTEEETNLATSQHQDGLVHETILPRNKLVGVGVSQDGAWPKRGRAMNSLSGVGTVCGERNRKCLGFTTRNKGCKKCTYLVKEGKSPTHPGCRKNWNRSAKAMEADMAVQLHQEAISNGLKYERLIGDDDSTAVKHIKERVNTDIEKYSDLVHVKRNLNEKLRSIMKQYKELSEKVVEAIINNFSNAVHQNRTKSTDDLQKGVTNIVPHMYGEHNECGSWCSYSSNPVGYRHKSLPYGKDLTDSNLRQELTSILETITSNPKKFMTTGDSQPNEALNNIIFTKAPKVRNYTMSESFDFRVAAGVCQYNEGTSYVKSVIKEATLSPRRETEDYLNKKDQSRQYAKQYKSARSSKRRRKILKSERRKHDVKCRVKLDVGYQQNILIDNATVDITEIVDPPSRKISCKESEVTTIYLDLETTKLGYDAEILQLAARACSGQVFNKYILPSGNISPKATEITGLNTKVVNGVKNLYKFQEILSTVSIKEALSDFVFWIQSLDSRKKVVCAHNGNKFDFPILIKKFEQNLLLEDLRCSVLGLADSLPIIKASFPNFDSYSLPFLYSNLLKKTYHAHDANSDVVALQSVIECLKIPIEKIINGSQSMDSFIFTLQQRNNIKLKINDLQEKLLLDSDKIVSDNIAKKIVMSGLSFDTLVLAHCRDPENGVKALFTEKIDNVVRVTTRKTIIEKVKQACSVKLKSQQVIGQYK